jgi:hypothetical protein
MSVATLIFAAIAAVGSVLAVVINSQPLLDLVEDKHRRRDHILQSYEEMFGRLYRFVMADLDEAGHVKAENAKIFTTVADNVMYLHSGSEAEAWQRYKEVHDL